MCTVRLIKGLVVVFLFSFLAACGDLGEESVVVTPGGGQGGDVNPPMIVSQSPSVDDNASIDTVVTLVFDEEIDPASIVEDSIKLTGPTGQVAGAVSYDPSQKQLTFVPESHLKAFSSYQVSVSGITDSYGNPIKESQGWTFATIFDQLPPTLPTF